MKPTKRVIDGKNYISINWSNDLAFNQFYLSFDGVNRGTEKFLKWHHYYVSYEVDYKKNKQYSIDTKLYLMYILEPAFIMRRVGNLWEGPDEYYLYRISKRDDKSWSERSIKTALRDCTISAIFQWFYHLFITLLLLFAPYMLLYLKFDSQIKLVTIVMIFPILATIKSFFRISRFGAVQMFFDIKLYRPLRALFMGLSIIGLIMTVIFFGLFVSKKELNMLTMVMILINIIYSLVNIKIFYDKLYKKGQLLF